MELSGIILAGGKSSRMGSNKALLPFGEKKLIENIVDLYKSIFSEIIIVSNEPEIYRYLKVKIVTDQIPGKGPLSGIHAGLLASSNFYSFFAACDMPFMEKELIETIIAEVADYDVTLPKLGEYLQPLFAVYSKNCIKPIEESLQKGHFKITGFYSRVKVNYVLEDKIYSIVDPEKAFFNVNTKEDLTAAKKIKTEKKNPT